MSVEDGGVSVNYRSLPVNRCLSIKDADGDCHIAIDSFEYDTQAEEMIDAVHEWIHCDTGSFYNRSTPYTDRARIERRVTKEAVYTLIPLRELIDVAQSAWSTIFDLAEHFGVTEAFMQRALEVYKNDLAKCIINFEE